MTMFIRFFCLCPLSLTIKLNFDVSKVVSSKSLVLCFIGKLQEPRFRWGFDPVHTTVEKFDNGFSGADPGFDEGGFG